MILRGTAIHRVGHGRCGLFLTPIRRLRWLAAFAASRSFFLRRQARTERPGISLIGAETHPHRVLPFFSSPKALRNEGLIRTVIGALVAVSALCGFVVVGAARAQTTWVDEINNSLMFSSADYPASNWEPYHKRLGSVREAVGRGDNKAVKREMGQWFTMLRHRAHGISDVGADQLLDCSLMVTSIQEYGIAVPAVPVGLAETGYSH